MFTRKLFCSAKYLASSIKMQIIPLWRKKGQYLTAKRSRTAQTFLVTIYFGRSLSESSISSVMDYIAVYFSQRHIRSVSKPSQIRCLACWKHGPHISPVSTIYAYASYTYETLILLECLSGHGHSTKTQYKCLNTSSLLAQKLPGALLQGGEVGVCHSHFLVVLEHHLTAAPQLSACVIHCTRPWFCLPVGV